MAERSLQAQIPHNHCFGCGPDNTAGLNLESFWTGEGPCVARFVPQAHHCAAPLHFVNGGIIATLIDCHCICMATAAAYAHANRPIGSEPQIFFATGQLTVNYPRPAPIAGPLELSAEILAATDTRVTVACTLTAQGKICATGEVIAVRVSRSWVEGSREPSAGD